MPFTHLDDDHTPSQIFNAPTFILSATTKNLKKTHRDPVILNEVKNLSLNTAYCHSEHSEESLAWSHTFPLVGTNCVRPPQSRSRESFPCGFLRQRLKAVGRHVRTYKSKTSFCAPIPPTAVNTSPACIYATPHLQLSF